MLCSRREIFVTTLAIVAPRWASGRQGLDQFAASEPPCGPEQQLTPALGRDGTFRAGAPLRTSLLVSGLTGASVTISGTLAGTKCGRIKGAEIDFWQADPSGRIDASGFAFRGRQLTDTNGKYHLTTIMPGATAGRAPHISIRVVVPKKAELWTEAFFPDDARNARDPRYGPELLLKKTVAGYVFDITISL